MKNEEEEVEQEKNNSFNRMRTRIKILFYFFVGPLMHKTKYINIKKEDKKEYKSIIKLWKLCFADYLGRNGQSFTYQLQCSVQM